MPTGGGEVLSEQGECTPQSCTQNRPQCFPTSPLLQPSLQGPHPQHSLRPCKPQAPIHEAHLNARPCMKSLLPPNCPHGLRWEERLTEVAVHQVTRPARWCPSDLTSLSLVKDKRSQGARVEPHTHGAVPTSPRDHARPQFWSGSPAEDLGDHLLVFCVQCQGSSLRS